MNLGRLIARERNIGRDTDRALMARIAELGKGRFYHTEDARNVPRIFTSETMVVSRRLFVERATARRCRRAFLRRRLWGGRR